MTEKQKEYLESRFRYYEKKSTRVVLILFGIILILHSLFAPTEWIEHSVKYLFRVCLFLVVFFLVAELLRNAFYPIIAKLYFSKGKNVDID